MTIHRRFFLSGLLPLAWPLMGRAAPASVMLARDAVVGQDPRGWLVSEKLDGVRALWDGRRLRFRSGRDIHAPAWFTRGLPAQALDGELWGGRGQFETLSGTVRRRQPDDMAWHQVRFAVFDLPRSDEVFARRSAALNRLVDRTAFAPLMAVAQSELPDAGALQRRLDDVVRAGGEGLMLHRADALWAPGRSDALRKLKLHQDAEAVVVGYEPGSGRHQGRMGALRVRMADGRILRLGTGFSDAEREHPPALGQVVTFTYRGHTDSGLPRFASYLRVRDEA